MFEFLKTLGYIVGVAAFIIGSAILAGKFIAAGRGDDDD